MNYAKFRGRASRSEYWYFALFYYLVIFVPAFIMSVLEEALDGYSLSSDTYSGNAGSMSDAAELFAAGSGIIVLAAAIGMFIPMLALTWRRLHDANFAGPLWFVALVPYGAIAVFVLTLLSSKPQGRRFDLTSR